MKQKVKSVKRVKLGKQIIFSNKLRPVMIHKKDLSHKFKLTLAQERKSVMTPHSLKVNCFENRNEGGKSKMQLKFNYGIY